MSERQGIEIDYCPTCRGVWLDRGELDKIIDRAAPDDAASGSGGAPQPQAPRPPGAVAPEVRTYPALTHGSGQKGSGRYEQPHKKKKSGFLSELFEM